MENGRNVVKVAVAAKMKGITRQGILKAIKRGELVATNLPDDDGQLYVYVNSLDEWTPRKYTKQNPPKNGGK